MEFQMEKTKNKFPIFPVVLCAVLTVVARLFGVGNALANEFLSTDIHNANSILLFILPVIKQMITEMAFASIVVAIAMREFAASSVKKLFWVYSLINLIDAVLSMVYDLLRKKIDTIPDIIIGIGKHITTITIMMLLFLILHLIMKYLVKKEWSMLSMGLITALIPSAVNLITVIKDCILTLFDVQFLPNKKEVLSMISDITTITLAGIAAAVMVIFLVRKLDKKKNTDREQQK